MYKDRGFFLEVGLPMLILFGGITTLIAGATAYLAPRACAKSFPNRETHWSMMTDCMVKVDGEFIPASNYRKIERD